MAIFSKSTNRATDDQYQKALATYNQRYNNTRYQQLSWNILAIIETDNGYPSEYENTHSAIMNSVISECMYMAGSPYDHAFTSAYIGEHGHMIEVLSDKARTRIMRLIVLYTINFR